MSQRSSDDEEHGGRSPPLEVSDEESLRDRVPYVTPGEMGKKPDSQVHILYVQRVSSAELLTNCTDHVQSPSHPDNDLSRRAKSQSPLTWHFYMCWPCTYCTGNYVTIAILV